MCGILCREKWAIKNFHRRIVNSDSDAIAIIGKACVLYTETIAYITSWSEALPKHVDAAAQLVLESTYFTSIYLIHNIITLLCRSSSWECGTTRVNGLLLSTFTCWFSSTVSGFVKSLSYSMLLTTNPETILQIKLILSPFLAYVKTRLLAIFNTDNSSIEFETRHSNLCYPISLFH